MCPEAAFATPWNDMKKLWRTYQKKIRVVLEPREERRRLTVISLGDRLASSHLEALAKNLIARQAKCGLKKPEFAELIGMSGSQFRYVRRRLANPSILMLATIAEKMETSLYELLENDKLGSRRNLSGEQMTQHLSRVIKEKFEASGMESKDEFAKMIGVSLPQLYLILNGTSNPSLLVVEEMGKRLDVGLWEMLGVEPARAPTEPSS
jgi:transcriptional regulator with XRE-family HTH domain